MKSHRNERGSVLVFVTLMIVVLLIMVGMGLDSGQLTFVRSQGQRAVDAAALAGASAVPTGSDAEVFARVAAFNTKAGNNQNDYVGSAVAANQLTNQHVTFVQYDKNTGSITAVGNALSANGVRVALETTNPYGGPAGGAMNSPLFLTPLLNLFGASTPANANVNVSAVAYVEPIPAFPIALAGCPLPPNPETGAPACEETCTTDNTVTLQIGTKNYPKTNCRRCNLLEVPGPRDNTCYTTFTWTSANAKSMKELINNYQTCAAIPPVWYSTPIYLNNGQITAALAELERVMGPFITKSSSADPPPSQCYLIPVVSETSNCNRLDPIEMFAEICVREVNTKGSPKYIFGDITCPVSPYYSRATKCYTPKLVRDTKSGM